MYNSKTLSKSEIGKLVSIQGWVQNIRKIKRKIFVIIRDYHGIFQVVINENSITQKFSKESVVKVQGTLTLRINPNYKIHNGDLEIVVKNLETISFSKQIPFEISNEINVNEDLRLKFRYLDLRRQNMRENLTFRYEIFHTIRCFLYENNFIEIETPILSKSTPEGARSFLVPTRKKGKFFALPQSPQIYKQLLMVSGFEKYFQFARVFRDEDLRKDRQFEFTQLDLEFGFANFKQISEQIENLIKTVWAKIFPNLTLNFPKMDYSDAIRLYGTEKPDLRFENKLFDLDFLNNSDKLFQGKTRGIFLEKILITKAEYRIFVEKIQQNKTKRLLYLHITDSKIIYSSFKLDEKLLIQSKIENWLFENNYQNGTLFLIADEYKNASQALGALRNLLANKYKLVNENEFKFLWIINWPLFELNSEKNLTPAHHPFTAPTSESQHFLDKEPIKTQAQAYDLVLNGFELGSGSIRIHNSELQNKIFRILGLTQEEINHEFGALLRAFNFGVPPHGGFAFGLDRLIMILRKTESIRDVIAFPINSKGLDLLLDSPAEIKKETLAEFELETVIAK
ncbi:aspartate--tRNA ligase [Mycoplasma flocculare]|uniref:aspartate--tRNA ligase n=1 Tax=Mesomycoplasma flocculare TaxID=2128 RepID=UPI001371795D|nr:aspartate--tRNA ligase [Mesomycoplasma flocculare]MXR13617.1 aspartate--tRNA ligase [Mesomycoplasma flocculare]